MADVKMSPLVTADQMMAVTLASQCAFNAATQHIFGVAMADAIASPSLGEAQEKTKAE